MSTTQPPPTLVMQLIIDPSHPSASSWPKGPWMVQAAHAATAAITISSSSRSTQDYISAANLSSMHKVVLATAKAGKAKRTLNELSEKLSAERMAWEKAKASAEAKGGEEGEQEFPQHYLWIEQPENTATCLAIAPNRKPAALKKLLRSCTLLKD